MNISIWLAYFLGAMSCWYAHVAGLKYALKFSDRRSRISTVVTTIGSALLMVGAIIISHRR